METRKGDKMLNINTKDIKSLSFCEPLEGISKNNMVMAELKINSFAPVLYFVKPKNIKQDVFNEILKKIKEKF